MRVQFQKQGIPWPYGLGNRPLHTPPEPFEPIIQRVAILKKRADESLDIHCFVPLCLSNGCGHTLPEGFLNLKKDGTVRYFFIYGNTPMLRSVAQAYHVYLSTNPEPISWNHNVPTWKPLFYEESLLGTLCIIWCLSQLEMFPNELIRMIAEYVYASYDEMCWFLLPSSSLNNGDVKEPQTKRIKN